jgi:dCTP deaminase
MNSTDRTPGLFPDASDEPSSNIVEYRRTGIIPYQGLKAMIADEEIAAISGIDEKQIQPASLDLRLGKRAYRVRASFLPGPNATVMDKVKQLDGLPAIDLTEGAVFEKGAVYVVELMESVRLPSNVEGAANPKSSTGRIDVLTRLITDRATAFDHIERGYKGALYVEIAPLTFSIVARTGSRLTQLRFSQGHPKVAASEVQKLYEAGQLVKSAGPLLPLREGSVPLTVDFDPAKSGIVGYKARKNTNKIDVDLVRHYDAQDFWEKIEHTGRSLVLDEGDFYILATREEVGVPPNLAAEMVPFHSGSGEFRVHYAGFFDPGFGWVNGHAQGSRAVLEVRSYGVSFTLEDGQIVGWIDYSWVAGRPDKVYGADLNSNYQGQGVALGKHFKPWAR